ncbi:MAG: outer membrane protein assembly factor BamD [Bacteroidaceae bacterium]|nr:outer membrane protein assembly factor BamD [Bacteroidaceae bacterium]
MKKNIFILVSLIMLLVSCDSYNKILTTNNIDYKYEAAKAYYLEGEYVKASQLLESVVTLMKGSDKAEESLILLAMCYYDSKDYETASQYFKVYYTNYPRGEFAEYARFHSGKSLYMDITEPELDQSDTYLAISELQLFMEYFPLSSLRPQAQEMIMRMHDLLVEKEFLSAQLYYDLGNFMAYRGNNYLACIITAQNALKDYPYTRLREDLSMLILRARYKMAYHSIEEKKLERYRETIDEYYAFKTEFPSSEYLDEAERYFAEAKDFVKE